MEKNRFSLLMLLMITQIHFLAAQEKIYDVRGDSIIVTALRERPIPEFSTIATKLDVPLEQIPLSVGIVNQTLISNQNDFILGDALKNVSGINTQTGFGVHDYFIIRGLNSLDNGLILTDGTIEPEVTYYNLYNVDRIEVLKGPGAFLYGSNPMSGTVNLVRKQPVFRNFLHVHSTLGQFGTQRYSADIGAGNPNRKLAARVNILWENADNYRDDKENRILAVNPAITWYVNPKTTVLLNAELIESRYKPDSGLPLMYNPVNHAFDRLADVARTVSYQTPYDFSDQKIMRVKLHVETKISRYLMFQTRLYRTDLDWDSRGTLINGAVPAGTGNMIVMRSMSMLEDIRKLTGQQTELIWSFSTGPVRHQLLTGFEWNVFGEDYRYDIAPSIPALDLVNPVETAVKHEIMVYPYLRGDASNRVLAPYILDQISLTDRYQLIAGMRYDRIHFENRAPGYETDRSFSHACPLFGFRWSPVREVSLYASAGTAYAPPSSQVIGDVDAERSIQTEFGFKQRFFDSRLNLDLCYYDLKKDNIAIPGMDGFSRLPGDQRSKGIEAEFQAEPVMDWFVFVSYAWTDAELTRFNEQVTVGQDAYGMPVTMVFDRSGKRPVFAPENLLNIWTTKEWRGLGAGGGLRYTSGQFIDEDNIYEIDPSLVWDAILYYKVKKVKISLLVRNLTDEDYDMRGFGNTAVIPARPRTILGKLDITLF
ncbi:TonB-dependent siderophore receptor [bacterium]|nr:TonB-dependent siderophore receptor [bacterium]